MTVLHGHGYGILGERIVAYARRIELIEIPISRTHRHRAQAARFNHAECYIVESVRWKSTKE